MVDLKLLSQGKSNLLYNSCVRINVSQTNFETPLLPDSVGLTFSVPRAVEKFDS